MRLVTLAVLVLLATVLCACRAVQASEQTATRVCSGTNHGLSFSHNGSDIQYRQLYENCTHILGGLEIVFLDRPFGRENVNRTYDLSFLSTIREVTDYVLIVGIHADAVPLTSLRIIRGQSLYMIEGSSRGYSLYVGQNFQPNARGIGLKQLELVSLHEIMDGSVMFHNNYELCFEETIDWKDILTGTDADVFYKDDDPSQAASCEACDVSCQQRCWGAGPDMCQKLTRNCAEQCDGSCYGPLPSDCCHPECVGGCTGPTKDKCWACREVINGNACENQCPPEFIVKAGKLVANPNARYRYGTVCVAKCPEHLLAVQGTCVSDCSEGYYEDSNGKCVKCDGLCPKTCDAVDFVHANNIATFEGCTVINGIVKILHPSLQSTSRKTPPISNVSDLAVFESVREITGALVIQASRPDFTSLSYFRNLRSILGRQLQEQKFSLQIIGTSLKTLDLLSLKTIRHGSVLISGNPNLCHVNTIDWNRFTNTSQLANNGGSANCSVCSRQCSSAGCWGPTETSCVSCSNFLISGQHRCVESCEQVEGGFYADLSSRECRLCNAECQSYCTGPGNGDCESCRNVQDEDGSCWAECPVTKYNDNGYCKACAEACVGGCTGPENSVGASACNFCSIVVRPSSSAQRPYCLPPDSECPDRFYSQLKRDPDTQKRYHECLSCHPLCLKCTGPSASACQECVGLSETDPDEGISRCVSLCSHGHYADKSSNRCLLCDSTCLQCFGPSASECTVCQELKVYKDRESPTHSNFTCTFECPEWAPNSIVEENGKNQTALLCVSDEVFNRILGKTQGKTGAIVGGVLGAIFLFGLVAIVIGYLRFRWAQSEENKARIHAKITGTPLDELEPLAPSGAQPDMAQMRIIKESELQKFDVIGSGAFGTVYKGVWIPADENVKVVVAVKVLREGSSAAQNAELLEEARIMASVIHPNCTRIIAVCMTAQMMLVMPFVPSGALLDYIRKNKANIGSKALLNWCTQIARGMDYLESRGIVHRDLAARNVLVQSDTLVKITDFGLAKLLDVKQETFQAEGGKMPIKWLAVESIHHRIFTHKSDVWSYGVTLWELFTFGQKPYDNVRAYDIPDLLEKGERLSQPSICTIDVYMILIKCWMLEASSRPSFKELAENFAKMSRDPGRYLVIQGDDLLRLPEKTYTASDLLSDVSNDTDELMTADDYLQPQHWGEQSDEKPKSVEPSKKKTGGRGRESAELKYGALEGRKGKPSDHRSSSRYIADPTGKGSPELAQKSRDSSGAAKHQSNLPVTEDDYLQPQMGGHSSAYMDIVPDDKNGSKMRNDASNPEYFDKMRLSDHVPTGDAEYYNSDVADLKVKRTDSGLKSKGFIGESAV